MSVDFSVTHAVPGVGKPLDYVPDTGDPLFVQEALPSALVQRDLEDGTASLPLTSLRELNMLRLMNAITDKTDWKTKVFDDSICEKWKSEATQNSAEGEMTEKMATYCIEELRFKAQRMQNQDPRGAIVVYNGDVVKSDAAVPESTKFALQQAVQALEAVPVALKDWHPGSDEKVLDLVHPSLFPLVYGESKILRIGARVTSLDDCVRRCGEGEAYVPDEVQTRAPGSIFSWNRGKHLQAFSAKFQWLPCEVDISGDRARIVSYINNLHPQKCQAVYRVIEDVITAAIPLWEFTLAPLFDKSFKHFRRIDYSSCEYDPDPEFGPETDGPQQWRASGEAGGDEDDDEEGDDDDYYERRQQWIEDTRRVVLPEPEIFDPEKHRQPEIVNLKEKYGKLGRSLQIIVKLANIELTPEKPEYGGGTWHVEGKLNEHIVATALYYYSSSNITPSSLAFRQMVDTQQAEDVWYLQGAHDWLQDVFGCENEDAAVQYVGGVDTHEGRLLTFPNILQHQVQPFQLADRSRPGHRKILALFLVDPNVRIASTADVPCQQLDWWREEVLGLRTWRVSSRGPATLTDLPIELIDQVFDGVEGFPISLEEAKNLRGELIDERRKFVVEHGQAFEATVFSLCEH